MAYDAQTNLDHRKCSGPLLHRRRFSIVTASCAQGVHSQTSFTIHIKPIWLINFTFLFFSSWRNVVEFSFIIYFSCTIHILFHLSIILGSCDTSTLWTMQRTINMHYKQTWSAIDLYLLIGVDLIRQLPLNLMYVNINAQASLRWRADSLEHSLLTWEIQTIITWAGSNLNFPNIYSPVLL